MILIFWIFTLSPLFLLLKVILKTPNHSIVFNHHTFNSSRFYVMRRISIYLREKIFLFKIILKKIDSKMARALASDGFNVIAASENPNGKGHIATLYSDQSQSTDSNPMIANVGSQNGIMSASNAFSGRDVEYYYDPSQETNYTANFYYEIGDDVE